MAIVIDDGSNQVKSKSKTLKKAIASRVVVGALTQTGNRSGKSERSWFTNGNEYTVSDSSTGTIETANDDYQTSDENRVLVHQILLEHDLSGSYADIHVTIPIGRFYKDKVNNQKLIDAKKASLMQPVQNLSGIAPAKVRSVGVWPEAIPAWYDYLLDENGAEIPGRMARRVLIVDIGGTTTDVCEIDGLTGDMGHHESLDYGVFNIMREMQDIQGMRSYDLFKLEQQLRNNPELTEKACTGVFMQLLKRLEAIQHDPEYYDVILYVGGGSAIMGDRLADQYGYQNGYIPEEPDYAVARGIHKFLLGGN